MNVPVCLVIFFSKTSTPILMKLSGYLVDYPRMVLKTFWENSIHKQKIFTNNIDFCPFVQILEQAAEGGHFASEYENMDTYLIFEKMV